MARIGVDVGGTHTDAVVMSGARVVSCVKARTTPDVTGGVVAALQGVWGEDNRARYPLEAVVVGTTHFTNAFAERRRLAPTAAIRLGSPAGSGLPPFTGWPGELRAAAGGHAYLCRGGYEYDQRPISPLDTAELRRVAADLAARGIRSAAITAVFSPINGDLERQAAAILTGQLPGLRASLSHEIGRVGLLERENATIINASLRELSEQVVDSLTSALRTLGMQAPLYFSQNDGTVMAADYARAYPVLTFASGPANSTRGAAFLSGLTECSVVDVGGTTTDVGVIIRGFPRMTARTAHLGGIRTNFRIPDVVSLGIGGGSRVHLNESVTVGPDSVGYDLPRHGRIFGGTVLTATDLAVAGGRAGLGDPSLVSGLGRDTVRAGLEHITAAVAGVVDRMRTTPQLHPVVVVGGGSILLPDSLPGCGPVTRPAYHAVANAIGAAIAQVGGETDRVFSLAGTTREHILTEAKQEAMRRAVAAGAAENTVEITEVDEMPLTYLPGNAVRVRARAVGELAGKAGSGA